MGFCHERFFAFQRHRLRRHLPDRLSGNGGDVMNVQTVHPQRASELWCIERTQWSAAEYDALAARYALAAAKMKTAVATKSFVDLRSAYLDLAEIADQTSFLNDGLFNAIESVNDRSTP